MKVYDLKNNDTNIQSYLKSTDLDNMFNVHIDKNNRCVYNLNSGLYLSYDDSIIQEYTCTTQSTWTLLSYKLYSTTRLAWLLMKLNDVKAIDVFKTKQPGDVIKYIGKEYVESIVEDINDTDDSF